MVSRLKPTMLAGLYPIMFSLAKLLIDLTKFTLSPYSTR